MHAAFADGPYGDDVGRCITWPPAPQTLSVELPDGSTHTCYLWTVGAWSDPEDPIAMYNPEPPSTHPQPLSDQGREILDRMPPERRAALLRTLGL